MTTDQGELIVYQSEDGQAAVDVRLKDETVWLTMKPRCRSYLVGKVCNIQGILTMLFKEGELDKKQVLQKMHSTKDGTVNAIKSP